MASTTDTSPNSLGSQVRQAREAHRLSVEGLAFKAGVSMRTVLRLEAGEVVPRRATLRVIADVLELDQQEAA